MTKRNRIIYWVFTLWASLGMVSTAIVQFTKAGSGAGSATSVQHLGYPLYFLNLLGAWKILGVVAILIPGFLRLKEWAYAGFFFAMSGAIYSHVAMHDGIKEIFPSALLLVLVVISWYFRPANRKLAPTT